MILCARVAEPPSASRPVQVDRQSSRSHLKGNASPVAFVCGPGPIPTKVEAMTRLSAVRFVGVSLEAVLLYRWLIDRARQPHLDDGVAVFRIEARHAPSLADFAALHPGRKGSTSVRSVNRWLAELRACGLVESHRTRVGNGYLVRVPAEVVQGFRGKVSRALPGGLQDATPVSDRCDASVPVMRHQCPTDATPVSHPVTGETGIQNRQHQGAPVAHSVQEPVAPGGPDDGVDGIGRALEALEGLKAKAEGTYRAKRGFQDAEARAGADAIRAELDDAMGALKGQAMGKADFARLKGLTRAILDRCNRLRTGDGLSDDGPALKYLKAKGIAAGCRQEAVEALQGIGTGEGTIRTLVERNAPEAILEAVRASKAKGIVNRIGYVRSVLAKREHQSAGA